MVGPARLAVALCAAVSPAPAVAEDPAPWDSRIKAFEQRAIEERRKGDLDFDPWALRKKYPKPQLEVKDRVSVACPGGTTTVRLAGTLLPGALVVVRSEQVEVVRERQDPRGWEGELRIAPDAAPERVSVTALSPVSAERTDVTALIIGCEHRFTIVVGDDQVTFDTDFGGRTPERVTATWSRGGKRLGRRTYDAALEGAKLDLLSRPTQEEERAQWHIYHALHASSASKEADAKGRESLEAKLHIDPAPFGCRSVTLWPRRGSVERGQAAACAGKPSLAFFPARGRYEVR